MCMVPSFLRTLHLDLPYPVHEYMFPLSNLNNSRYPLNRHTWILLVCVCVCVVLRAHGFADAPIWAHAWRGQSRTLDVFFHYPLLYCLHWTWSSPFLSRLAGQWVLRVYLSRPLNAHLTLYTKTNWKQIDRPNIRSKMIKLLEENMNKIFIPLDPAMDD